MVQDMPAEFCVALAYNDPRDMATLAREAEACGFGGVVLSDHLVHPEELRTPYPYTRDGAPRWPAGTDWPDPLVTVGALASVTSRLRFIVSIYVLGLRHPIAAAKSIATAAVLAENRLVLGVGAGWMRDEFEALGVPFERRGARLDESIEVMRKLWGGEPVAHEGEFYSFPALSMHPVPAAPVPIWGGGLSAPALRRAATRCDGWLSEVNSEAEVREIVARLRALRETSARCDRPFSICAALNDVVDLDGYKRMAALGVTQLITVPWLFFGRPTCLADKVDGLHRFADQVLSKLGREDGVAVVHP
jgi:probable F420-dependent oxidoreductase